MYDVYKQEIRCFATSFITLMVYRVHLTSAGVELTTLVVIGTDFIGSCKSNYHMITTTMTPRNTLRNACIQHFTWAFRFSFVWTAIDWNHLDENTVSVEKLECFKSALAHHRD
jgi:hypothetical protein